MRKAFGIIAPALLVAGALTCGMGFADWVKAPCSDGFGRFGWKPAESVLVGGLSEKGVFGRGATWGFPMVQAQVVPDGMGEPEVVSVNWVRKTLRFSGEDESRDLTVSILSPWILVEGGGEIALDGLGVVRVVGAQPQLAEMLTLAYPSAEGLVRKTVAPAETLDVDVAQLAAPWVAVWDEISSQPILVTFTGKPEAIRLEPAGDAMRLSIPDAGTRGVCFPLGRTPLARARERLSEANSETFAGHCSRLALMFLAYPDACREEFEVEGESIRVRDTYSYRMLESAWNVEPLQAAPIPPMISSARRLGYPVGVEVDTSDLHIPTVWGPFEVALGTDESLYRLPIPPLEETGFVDVRGRDELKAALNACAGLEGYPEPGYNGFPEGSVSVNFPSKITGNALCAWALLTPEQQQELMNANAGNMAAWAVGEDPLKGWTWRTEPYTGLRYPTCYGQTSGVDISWGSGLAVNGLQKYAHIFGEWDSVRRNWRFVNGAMAYIEWGHDWAIMGDSASDDGRAGFGIDVGPASYLGAVSAARMARVLEMKDEYARYAGLAAKLAVPLVVRAKFDEYAWEHELHCDRHFINGFQEGQLWQHNAASGDPDPWWLTCSYNGYGVHQELFDLTMLHARREVAEWAAMVPQYFPRILDGEKVFRYPYPTTHNGNSGYITLHWFHTRVLLGEDETTLVGEMARNRETSWSGFYWMAPIVYATLMDRQSPIVLSEWAPAAYVAGAFDPTKDEAEFLFRLPENGATTIVAGVAGRPAEVLVNGVVSDDWAFDGAGGKIAGPRPSGLRPNYARIPITGGDSRVVVRWRDGQD